MTSRYEAYMDGTALSTLDSSIYIHDIKYGEVRQNISTSKVAGRPGARVINKDVPSCSVTILFEIHKYGIADRQEVCQKVCKWANGSILTTNDRTGQELKCVCESYPSVSARDWTEQLSVTFAGYNPPYWQDSTPTTATMTGTSNSMSKYVPGSAPEALVSATITANASVSTITLAAGSKTMVLTGMGASTGDTITVGYDDNNILYIKKNGTSILNKRTGADDLSVECGKESTFAYAASDRVGVVFSVRGCWY